MRKKVTGTVISSIILGLAPLQISTGGLESIITIAITSASAQEGTGQAVTEADSLRKYIYLGYSAYQNGKSDPANYYTAEAYFRRALEFDPQHYQANYFLGKTLLEQFELNKDENKDENDLSEAISCFINAANIEPEKKNPRVMLYMALELHINNSADGTVHDWVQAKIASITSIDTKADLSERLGYSFYTQGISRANDALLEEALLSLNIAHSYYSIAHGLGNDDTSIRDILSKLNETLAYLNMVTGRTKEAIDNLQILVEKEPSIRNYYSLAFATSKQGLKDKAAKAYGKVISIAREREMEATERRFYLKALSEYADLLINAGQRDKAVPLLEELYHYNPSFINITAYNVLIAYYEETGNLGKQKEYLEAAIIQDGDSPYKGFLYYQLGNVLASEGAALQSNLQDAKADTILCRQTILLYQKAIQKYQMVPEDDKNHGFAQAQASSLGLIIADLNKRIKAASFFGGAKSDAASDTADISGKK